MIDCQRRIEKQALLKTWFQTPKFLSTGMLLCIIPMDCKNAMSVSRTMIGVGVERGCCKEMSLLSDFLCCIIRRKRKVREIEEKNRSNQDKRWKRKGSDSKKTKHRRH